MYSQPCRAFFLEDMHTAAIIPCPLALLAASVESILFWPSDTFLQPSIFILLQPSIFIFYFYFCLHDFPLLMLTLSVAIHTCGWVGWWVCAHAVVHLRVCMLSLARRVCQ
jgi:hypothetical protein